MRALGELLHVYWQPLYGFARRSGLSSEDAADAVQGFCESLIRRSSLQSADPLVGRLRSFLLGAFRNHLKASWRAQHRQKRGGFSFVVDDQALLAGLDNAVDPGVPPDEAFDRLWVNTLLSTVLANLRAEYVARGRGAVYEALEPFLCWGGERARYAQVAESLGFTESAVQQAVHRLRQRYRVLLEKEIGQTANTPEEAQAEREHLLAILAGARA